MGRGGYNKNSELDSTKPTNNRNTNMTDAEMGRGGYN